MNKIFEKLENEIDKALENMPSGLSVRNRRRYVGSVVKY